VTVFYFFYKPKDADTNLKLAPCPVRFAAARAALPSISLIPSARFTNAHQLTSSRRLKAYKICDNRLPRRSEAEAGAIRVNRASDSGLPTQISKKFRNFGF
jgi:hypothetical protein